jgi:hypothetical protein
MVNDCSCLNVTGSVQPTYSGQYYLQNGSLNDRPVYKRSDCDLYLYNYEDATVSYWIIGPTLGGTRGLANNINVFRDINETSKGWSVYSTSLAKHVPDPDLTVTCSCSVSTCSMGEFILNGSSLFDGVFKFNETTYNGRPVYKHSEMKLVLYYQKTTSCEYWMVSDGLGLTVGLLYAYDPTTNPQAVTTWKTNPSSTTVKESSIQFVCYTASASMS